MITGIDVSKAQGVINWDTVLSSKLISFAFCKATEGVGYKDPQFAKNWSEIKRIGMLRGAYHFAHPDNDPVAEANYFISAIGPVEQGDMLCLDIEKENNLPGDKFTAWVLSWLETVQSKTNIKPIIYTGGPYFNQHDGNPSQEIMTKLSKYPLWLAAYTNSPDKFIPDEWKSLGWTMWQQTGDVAPSGVTVLHVPGIPNVVDRDLYKGSVDDLKAFADSLYENGSTSLVDGSTSVPAISNISELFEKGLK